MGHPAAILLACFFQCSDPPTPPGAGFPVASTLNQTVVLSDGYQVLVDVRRPNAAAGPCGWPVLAFVHGLNGSRLNLAGIATTYAAAGYVTVAYDVRGQGPSAALNPGNGNTYYGLRERMDLGEVLEWVEATFPAVADFSRIGVTGASQGGLHSWMAAAWSGLPYGPNPWNAGSFPSIDAVVAESANADHGESFAPMDLSFGSSTTGPIFGTGVQWNPSVTAVLQPAVLNEDVAAWAAYMNDPVRDLEALVPSIGTAVMAQMAYDDFVFPSHTLPAIWQTLPAGTPKKLYLGTGGHSSPTNNGENAFRSNWRRQWFDRFLKGIANGIDSGPTITYAVTPNVTSQYLSSTYQWTHRTASAWPPEGSVAYRLHLRQGGALSTEPPTTAEPAETLTQTVAAGYDMADMVAANFSLANALVNIPLVTTTYQTDPLPAPVEIAGTPAAHLRVSSPGTRYQIRAALIDVDAGGTARYVAGGSGFAFDNVPAGPNALEVPITANAYVFAAGHRVRLRLENLQIHEPPTGQSLRFLPYPHPFSVDVRHTGAEPSWIDLPSRPAPIAVSVAPSTLSASAGGTTSIGVTGGLLRAGGLHIVLAGLSGSTPGVAFGTGTLLLNPDALTTIALWTANTPLFANFAGFLDAGGNASASFHPTPGLVPPSLVGQAVTFTAVVLSGIGDESASNAVTVTFTP